MDGLRDQSGGAAPTGVEREAAYEAVAALIEDVAAQMTEITCGTMSWDTVNRRQLTEALELNVIHPLTQLHDALASGSTWNWHAVVDTAASAPPQLLESLRHPYR
jgi:hypothetical protein